VVSIPNESELLEYLRGVPDPEIPVLNVVEMGIVRGVTLTTDPTNGNTVTVTITPTYSGCPAMREIEADIRRTLQRHGVRNVSVNIVHSPPWTTDCLSAEAREKLRLYGIAPPGRVSEESLVGIRPRGATVPCPYCGAKNTTLRSEFGSTACKSLYVCNGCRQPFEHFKPF